MNQGHTASIFLEDLDRIDVTIFTPEYGVKGASWHVDLTVCGRLDENGFVHDFSPLKNRVKEALKGSVDHALLVPADHPDVDVQIHGETIHVRMTDRSRDEPFIWEYEAPRAAVLLTPGLAVGLDQVTEAIEGRVREALPDGIERITIGLRNEEAHASEALFSYTHGITGHQGLCQRLLHGHRSKIKVEIDGERRPEWEHRLVQDVLGPIVHIAAPWQIESGQVEAKLRSRDVRPVTLAYKASLGEYRAVVPSDKLLLIEGETSIENLTGFLARHIRAETPTASTISVSCYEGIGKGSIATV